MKIQRNIIVLVLASLYFCLVSSEGQAGTLRGYVHSASLKKPLAYANVVVMGTFMGAATKENGEFIIYDLPAGAYTLKVYSLGHKPTKIDVEVGQEEVVELYIEVHLLGLSDEVAAEITVGSNVSASSVEFQCEVVPGSDHFRVGDAPSVVARIRNNSSEKVYLIRSLDGSDAGRFPQVTITIDGPQGGFKMPPGMARCGNMNALSVDDFSAVRPGDVFEPFNGGFLPIEFEYGRFAKPGRYTATFIYSTLSDDIRDYQGYPPKGRLSGQIVARVSRVPRIEIKQSVSFDVYP